MRIVHVTSSLSLQGAGVRTVVEALARAQTAAGHVVRVIGLEDQAWKDGRRGDWSGVEVEALGVRGPAAFGYAGNMATVISAFRPDVVHLHGIWMHPVRSVMQWHLKTGKPFVMSVHGMLSEVALSYSPFKKRLVRFLFQDKAFSMAACLQATSHTELQEIRAFGIDGPVAVVPHGVFPVALPSPKRNKLGKTLLTLGRLHPKKGIDVLLKAWARLERNHPDWSLRIVGPDENGHAEELKALAVQLGVSRVVFAGPVYGSERDLEMACADIFVLPTRSENFAMTVAESLMLEVPVVSSKGAPWADLEENRCGRWVDLAPRSLADALNELMLAPDEIRSEMGKRGRAWMLRDYTWPIIGEQIVSAYEWVAGSKSKPATLHFGEK